jgi:sugar phosphate isomerase/epimerase
MIALSTGSLYVYGTARVFELAAKAGFDGIEVLCDHRPDTRDPAYLRRLSSEYGLPIVALHSPFTRALSAWPADQWGRLKRTVALAQALEVPIVVAHLPFRLAGVVVRWDGALSGRVLLPLPWSQRKPWYRACVEGRLADLEAASGVRIAVENMPQRRALGVSLPSYWFNRPEQMRRFEHVTLDTTHVGTWGWDLLAVYETLRDRIAHVHLSNYDGREHRAPVAGHLPLAALLQRLAKDGYSGAISVESNPQALGAEDAGACREMLVQTVAFCREHTNVPGRRRRLTNSDA